MFYLSGCQQNSALAAFSLNSHFAVGSCGGAALCPKSLGAICSSGRWAVHDRLPYKRCLRLNALECTAGCQVSECCHTLSTHGLGVSVLSCRTCLCVLQLLHALGGVNLLLGLCSLPVKKKGYSMHLILFSYAFIIHLRRWGPTNEKMRWSEDPFPKKLQICQAKLQKGIFVFTLGCWPKAKLDN